jgi:hypothetical protein
MEQVDRDKDSIAIRVKFGLFEADLRSGELRRSGRIGAAPEPAL